MKKPPATVTSEPQEFEHQIRARQLNEEPGKAADRDLDDWLRAEAEITSKKIRTAVA